jgi:hypothetical protein
MSAKKPYTEQYLPSNRAAELLGVSSRTLRRWREESAIAQNKNQEYGLVSLLFTAIDKANNGKPLKNAQAELAQAQAQKTWVEVEIKRQERDKLSDKLLDSSEASQVWEKHQDKLHKRLNRLINELPEKLEQELPSAIADRLTHQQKQELLQQWREKIAKELEQIWE